MIDFVTNFLFSPFPREVSDPIRKPIKEYRQFVDFIDIHDGITDCYCDLYPYPWNGLVDKIYFDIDGTFVGKEMEQSLPYAQLFYDFLVNVKHLDVIPVASGKKGFNLYVILKPQSYPNAKQLLHDVSWSLICELFGKVACITYHDEEDRQHPSTAILDDKGNIEQIICIDPKVIADVRRFSRVPNTKRPPENLNYCTYLPPEEFLDMSIEDIKQHIRSPHIYKYNLNAKIALQDIPILPNLESYIVNHNSNGNNHCNGECGYSIDTHHSKESILLEMALRPCLYKALISSEPRHDSRVAATVDLLKMEFTPSQILKMYSKLNWMDFDSSKTFYQIRTCQNLLPYGKRKLQSLGICYNCERACR